MQVPNCDSLHALKNFSLPTFYHKTTYKQHTQFPSIFPIHSQSQILHFQSTRSCLISELPYHPTLPIFFTPVSSIHQSTHTNMCGTDSPAASNVRFVQSRILMQADHYSRAPPTVLTAPMAPMVQRHPLVATTRTSPTLANFFPMSPTSRSSSRRSEVSLPRFLENNSTYTNYKCRRRTVRQCVLRHGYQDQDVRPYPAISYLP